MEKLQIRFMIVVLNFLYSLSFGEKPYQNEYDEWRNLRSELYKELKNK